MCGCFLRSLARALSLLIALCLPLVMACPARALDTQPELREATAAALVDGYGNVLYESGGELELPLASITKVMTAMVALDSGYALDEPVTFVADEYPEDSQLAGYEEGDAPTFGELLDATLVYSANDAAANLAYAVAGSTDAFAELMNAKAAELGLVHTHFANPHGLEEEGHYSCALDLCALGRYAIEHYPFIRTAVKTRSVVVHPKGQDVTLPSTDDLMDTYAGLRGIKTGNTQSGTSFLSCATRNHVTLYSCVLCCETKEGRFDDTASLLDWGFGLFEQTPLARSSWAVGSVPWQDGFWLSLPVAADRDVNGSVFCEGSALEPEGVRRRPSLRGAPSSTRSVSLWWQDGRYVQGVSWRTAALPQRPSAWNALVSPLFEDEKGRAAL